MPRRMESARRSVIVALDRLLAEAAGRNAGGSSSESIHSSAEAQLASGLRFGARH